MKNGMIMVGAASPMIHVGNPTYNIVQHIEAAKEAHAKGVKVLVFSELGISGYTCGDLFHQYTLLAACESAVATYLEATKDFDMISFVGVPVMVKSKLYNCAAVISHGEILGLVPKTHLPNYSEFYDVRQFTKAPRETYDVMYCEREVPFGANLLFSCREMPSLIIGAEICEDVWVNIPPSCYHAEAGATLMVNLSASDEVVGKAERRRNLIAAHSVRTHSVYIYAAASEGESGADMVFSGHCLLAQNGRVVVERPAFDKEPLVCAAVDMDEIVAERMKANTVYSENKWDYTEIPFSLEVVETPITHPVPMSPFLTDSSEKNREMCGLILEIQATALAGRLTRAHASACILGLSGGLDSTLALIAMVRAVDKLGWNRKTVIGVTMPCYGTTKRTRSNAEKMADTFGITLRTVDIKEAVDLHFRDIGHDPENHNVVYENSQARERTQILMDIANAENALVVGTGDLSELALGWCTYNGDHMSMYAVNASIPKTLIRYLVAFEADRLDKEGRASDAAVLRDVLDTPVSPELLPPRGDEIAQCTEEIVGPYALHDYFLYYFVKFGYTPKKILHMAKASFEGVYTEEVIRKWLKVFVRKFFTQQFKRSCVPEGPKVGAISLSPRSDWRMVGDADVSEWLKDI